MGLVQRSLGSLHTQDSGKPGDKALDWFCRIYRGDTEKGKDGEKSEIY